MKHLPPIDTDALAVERQPEKTAAEVNAIAKGAGLTELANLEKWQARKDVGEFLGVRVHGALASESAWTLEQLADAEKVMMDKVKWLAQDGGDTKEQLLAIRALDMIWKRRAEQQEIILRSAEVDSKIHVARERQARAPQLGNQQVSNNVIVQIGPDPPPLEEPKQIA